MTCDHILAGGRGGGGIPLRMMHTAGTSGHVLRLFLAPAGERGVQCCCVRLLCCTHVGMCSQQALAWRAACGVLHHSLPVEWT